MSEQANNYLKLFTLPFVFYCGWYVPTIMETIDYWLTDPPPAYYVGLDNKGKTFVFDVDFYGLVKTPYTELGGDTDTANLINDILKNKKYFLCLSRYSYGSERIELYLLGEPNTLPMPLHTVLPKLLSNNLNDK